MSRCFPYPPPGYTLSSARKEPLIESIKLQKDKVKAEEQRKKDKKVKEKKRLEKKDKKERKIKNLDKSYSIQGHINEKFQTSSKAGLLQKGSKAESEQLERSSLTEEHEKPVFLHVPSSSSDSTENSNKRKRLSSPPDVNRGRGNIIRIRLPSKKQKQAVDASANLEEPCSTSGRTGIPSDAKDDIFLRLRVGSASELASGNIGQSHVSRTDQEQICSTSKSKLFVAPVKPQISSATTPMHKDELRFRNLIDNCVLPRLIDTCLDTEGDDWLFSRKSEGAQPKKRPICRDNVVSCTGSTSSLWPRATYLPEVDVFALPFTVPF